MERYDVIVIGAGVMGCATAYQLARRGRRVLLLEQFAAAHERGSSHGHSRIIRLAYDAPDYVRLAHAAFPLWRALEAESGTSLLLQTGGLDFALPGTPTFEATRQTLDALNVPYEHLDRAAIAARFPQFALPNDTIGIYQADAGILNASLCVATLAAEGRRHGALIREHTPVQQITATGSGVEVRSAAESFQGDRLVITAGAWARPLLRQVGLELPLVVTKEQVAFFAPHDPTMFEPGRFPIFIHHDNTDSPSYGFPIFGLPGVKVAQHGGGLPVEPDDDDRSVLPTRTQALRAYVEQWLPQAAGQILFAQTCRYTNTPDEHFIIDRHPEYPQIVIGSPCSGHGFKFGILIGKILADLAEHGSTDQPIGMFGLQRFGYSAT